MYACRVAPLHWGRIFEIMVSVKIFSSSRSLKEGLQLEIRSCAFVSCRMEKEADLLD